MITTKQKILSQSLHLFNSHGVSNVSLRMIADQSGISVGNLQYHFKKREDIIEALYFQLVENLNKLLELAKKSLNPKGKLLIFSLKTKNNKIPCFKKMQIELQKSLKRDELLFKIIRKNLKKTKESLFKYKVKIPTKKYLRMIKSRYISCLLSMNNKDLMKGIEELRFKHSNKMNFIDTLKCISFKN